MPHFPWADLDRLHEAAPTLFNPDYRPGLGAALEAAYRAWSDANPAHSIGEGMNAHEALTLELMPQYPTRQEALKRN